MKNKMSSFCGKIKETKFLYLTALMLILIMAFWVRIHNIENAPSGVYPDEAVNGIDALKALKSRNYEWFYPDNNGREGLFMNLIAFSFSVFGVTVLGLKFPSIVFGTLSVLGTYLLTKELFRSRRAGLLAAFFVAFSFWSINFSRISFRAIMLPTILTFSFYYIFLGLRTFRGFSIKRGIILNYFYFALAGFIFGIGLHTYIAFRIAPAILAVLFLALWITKRNFIRDYWSQGIIFIIFAFVSMSPILLTFNAHPEYLTSRSGDISVLSPEVNQGNPVKALSRSLALSIFKYNIWGDQNWRHNYPPYPILNPILGVSFLAGLIYLIAKWFHLLFIRLRQGVRDRKFYVYSFILAWFFAMLAPEFMTAEGLPHALRSIGTLPAAYIIAVIPILWLLGKRNRFDHGFKFATVSFVLILTLLVGFFNTIKYHNFWAGNKKQYDSFEGNLMQLSVYLKTLPDDSKKIVIARNMQIIPIKLFNYDMPNTFWSHPDSLNSLPEFFKPDEKKVFILTEKEMWMAEKIMAFYPGTQLKKFEGKFGEAFWTIE
ncbi:MAG: glycosyltransferase family 39 protein [Candidatus Moranbacteria bacterium]|nr:glycosyltransferase family 39 protein [Candidatus Moranbacteria bacterium]